MSGFGVACAAVVVCMLPPAWALYQSRLVDRHLLNRPLVPSKPAGWTAIQEKLVEKASLLSATLCAQLPRFALGFLALVQAAEPDPYLRWSDAC